MARLVLKLKGAGEQVILLRLGVNRLGRSTDNDFTIEHPTISSRHCDIVLSEAGLLVRDRTSTNGTFLDGKTIHEAWLCAGQTLRLGDVELLVDDTEVRVSIPKFDLPIPAPPVVGSDGALMCRAHEQRPAAYQCTHCLENFCEECVHKLRRRRGKFLLLCPLCSHPCEPRVAARKTKERWLRSLLLKAVKPLSRKHTNLP
jgi:hypothetical protein